MNRVTKYFGIALLANFALAFMASTANAGDYVKLSEAKTINGQSVSIEVGDNGVRIDNANVIATDIGASNGVIHVIDTVILPSS